MTNPYLERVQSEYPGAQTASDLVDSMFDLIQNRYQLAPHQLMHADSICSDDVNTMEYPKRAYEMLGPFEMGGLNGFPFTGLTGMGAFANHVPEDGAVFIFYAPHIGMTKEGTLGLIHRVGQSKPSGCCGAARAALAKLTQGDIQPDVFTDLDYQQNTIEQIFLKRKERILTAANPLKEATEVMYEATTERIDLLVSQTRYACKRVLVMGGILINGDPEMGSFCQRKRFDVIDLSDHTCENLRNAL